MSVLLLTSCAKQNVSNETTAGDFPVGQPMPEAREIQEAEKSQPTLPHLRPGEFSLSPDLQHLDPNKIVPQKAFQRALTFYQKYRAQFKNQRFLGIVDFTQVSAKKRFYLINLISGDVIQFLVAHGKNSDPNADGLATAFSNIPESLKSSLGAYMVAETYVGQHGYSVRLDGLQSTNSNARSRSIVIHPADYVSTEASYAGRSFGCPAVDPIVSTDIINSLQYGGLLFASY